MKKLRETSKNCNSLDSNKRVLFIAFDCAICTAVYLYGMYVRAICARYLVERRT